MTKIVHLIVFNGFADWEPALALAELRRSGNYEVRTIGFGSEPVRSMGGLQVEVDQTLSDTRTEEIEFLILPGGDRWEPGNYPAEAVHSLLKEVEAGGKPIAAICGATLALARAGLLDERRHTSNVAEFLVQNATAYAGAERYRDELAVRDQRVITASGLGSVEFAREILAETGVYSDEHLALWFEAFKHGRYSR